MRNRTLPIALFVAALALAALACGGSFSTAKITDAVMAADDAGNQPTTIFAPDQVFYCIVKLSNAPEDTTLKAVWTGVTANGETQNVVLNETETQTGSDDTFAFHLTNDQPWPAGTYKVDIYLNGELDRTLNFEVQ